MGLEEFRILFDNSYKTYYTGQTVTGKVVLVLDSPKTIRGIRVRIKGEAYTSWTVRMNEDLNHYLGNEEYFSTRYYIAGSDSGELELSTGKHEFPFEYALPPDLPSSFESDIGHVRYTIKGTIDRPWKFDHETKDAFTVVSNYDLNTDSRASESVTVEETKTFGLFYDSLPLTVSFTLPVIGYVPGQSIPIKVNINNESGISVNAVRLTLDKYVTYRLEKFGPDFKTERVKIAEVCKQLEDNNIFCYEQLLKIPPLPPSNFENCGIIDIKYILKLKAYVNRLSSTHLKMATPILIGTVPLDNYQSLVAGTRNNFLPASDMKPTTPIDILSDNKISSEAGPSFNFPPLTYEESMFEARNLRDDDESEHVIGIEEPFAPRYPVYNL